MDVRIVVCLAFLAAAANCKEQRGPPWISFESGCDNPDFTKISQSLNRDAKEDWVKHKKQGVNCATIFKCDGSKADGKVCLSRGDSRPEPVTTEAPQEEAQLDWNPSFNNGNGQGGLNGRPWRR
ncbi:uncharacterized protein LOC135496935 isoform X1 [Lineus longissimus]|uniref:uncharacterized protein LOC135496935 isoform X1 n=1 Tax=Lineus longissimus TaxID=88925 RepID=UPI002B4DB686